MAAKKKPAPKRGASRYQAPAKQPIPGWLWMAIGLTVGAVIVIKMKLEPGKGDDGSIYGVSMGPDHTSQVLSLKLDGREVVPARPGEAD